MVSVFLTEGLVDEFAERLKLSTDVWIASAWVTRSDALNDLLTSDCRVKALVGTHGNATDPDAVQSLVDGNNCDVRLVEGGALFHPKLYLFRRSRRKTVAWIGSANFTGAGLAGNREVMLEFDEESAISEMESWFDERWRALRNQEVNVVLCDYRERRARNGVGSGLESLVEPVPAEGAQHLRDLRTPTTYRFEYFGEDRWASSHAELARRVLLAFSEVDADFLVKFARKDRARVAGNRRVTRRYVSRRRDDLGPPQDLPKKALSPGWWMGQKLADYHFYQGKTHPGILKMACATFGVTYGEGDVGVIDFASPKSPEAPSGYNNGDTVVVKIGSEAERHVLR